VRFERPPPVGLAPPLPPSVLPSPLAGRSELEERSERSVRSGLADPERTGRSGRDDPPRAGRSGLEELGRSGRSDLEELERSGRAPLSGRSEFDEPERAGRPVRELFGFELRIMNY